MALLALAMLRARGSPASRVQCPAPRHSLAYPRVSRCQLLRPRSARHAAARRASQSLRRRPLYLPRPALPPAVRASSRQAREATNHSLRWPAVERPPRQGGLEASYCRRLIAESSRRRSSLPGAPITATRQQREQPAIRSPPHPSRNLRVVLAAGSSTHGVSPRLPQGADSKDRARALLPARQQRRRLIRYPARRRRVEGSVRPCAYACGFRSSATRASKHAPGSCLPEYSNLARESAMQEMCCGRVLRGRDRRRRLNK